MTTDITIGKNIKSYREINGFTQDVVANFLGVKREMISYYENGAREVPLEILLRLCDLYGIDMEDIYEEDLNVVRENVICAFRTDGVESGDLDAISQFKAIVKNYIKINKLISSI